MTQWTNKSMIFYKMFSPLRGGFKLRLAIFTTAGIIKVEMISITMEGQGVIRADVGGTVYTADGVFIQEVVCPKTGGFKGVFTVETTTIVFSRVN